MPEAEGPYTHDVFISYNHAQKDWALDLARRLRDAGLGVWFDEWSLRPGERWIHGLEHRIHESRHFAFVASPQWLDAEWPTLEGDIAVLDDPSGRKRKIIPLLHTTCDLPGFLASRQRIDFRDTHIDAERYEFRLARLMATLDPARDYPEDFEVFRRTVKDYDPDAIPPPGPLPHGSLMPFPYNPLFVGREDELRVLARWLLDQAQATVISQVAAATGLGGIGKTQLAVAFVHRYGRRFPGRVFWLDVSAPEGIAEQVATCASLRSSLVPTIPMSRHSSTTWEACSKTSATSPPHNSPSNAPCASTKPPSAPTTPTSPRTSTTWEACSKTSATSPPHNRPSNAPCASLNASTGQIIPARAPFATTCAHWGNGATRECTPRRRSVANHKCTNVLHALHSCIRGPIRGRLCPTPDQSPQPSTANWKPVTGNCPLPTANC